MNNYYQGSFKIYVYRIWIFSFISFAIGCNNSSTKTQNADVMNQPINVVQVSKDSFGVTPEGTADLYTLTNAQGMSVQITNYAGIIVSIKTPDRKGQIQEVTHGFGSLAPYLDRHPHFGALIGRYGNRIGGAQFELDGTIYRLAANNGDNHLHGGIRGFDKFLWDANEVKAGNNAGVELRRTSKDMEEGYPGNLDVRVTYWLKNDNSLVIEYYATSDKKTICNLTNHAYFNLSGAETILDHQLMINADQYTPVDKGLIPDGRITSVANTPFDFRTATKIGERIDADHPQLNFGGGYDHNYVLNRTSDNEEPQLAATVYAETTGRYMEVFTTEPGVQLYTGNFLDGQLVGHNGQVYNKRSAFCLETQHYPDSPNKPDFPSVVLNPGEEYRTTTIYKFSTK